MYNLDCTRWCISPSGVLSFYDVTINQLFLVFGLDGVQLAACGHFRRAGEYVSFACLPNTAAHVFHITGFCSADPLLSFLCTPAAKNFPRTQRNCP